MSFNAKDMTQGGQIASMRIRMFSQIANIMLYCLFIFFWILVGLVLWVKISWQTFVNGCIYWWCTTLEGMRDLIKSQPVYEIQYYGKTFRMWGLNLSRHTHIRQEAINRLWGWAVIAQFAYYLAGFPWYEGNILFAFAVAAQVLTWCETRTWWRSAETMLLLAMWLPFSGTSYGIAGLLMLAVSHRLYRAEDRMERLALVACLLAVIPALNLATSDAAAVAGLVMTVLTVGLVSCTGKSLPRFWYGDFFPTFYACHLTVLGVLAV